MLERITLTSKLFTVDPDLIFSKRRKVKEGLLNELYFRYFIKEYTFKDLQEYYELKTKRKAIDRKNLGIWLKRIEVYKRAKMALDEGAKECTPGFFGIHSEFVLKELKKRINK